jgi:hypothetical protein
MSILKTNYKPKEKAIDWVDTFFKQTEEGIHHDLTVEVKMKNVPSIISLAQRLGGIKGDRAEIMELVLDAETLIDLVQAVINNELFDDEDKEDYLTYIFSI